MLYRKTQMFHILTKIYRSRVGHKFIYHKILFSTANFFHFPQIFYDFNTKMEILRKFIELMFFFNRKKICDSMWNFCGKILKINYNLLCLTFVVEEFSPRRVLNDDLFLFKKKTLTCDKLWNLWKWLNPGYCLYQIISDPYYKRICS